MDRNPHVHTYADRRARIGVPRDRASLARALRAFLAEEAAAWRRGKPGRLAVAADTFGAVACWLPRWRQQLAQERQVHAWEAWPMPRSRRMTAALRAARIRQEQRRAALDRQARARRAA